MLARLPFFPNQASGDDRLGGAIQRAVNVVIDGHGVVRRRPGIATYAEAPAGVVDPSGIGGLFSSSTGKLLATSAVGSPLTVYSVMAGTVADLSGGNAVYGNGRPVFAETEAIIAVTAGEIPRKLILATSGWSDLNTNGIESTHLIANTQRLLSNNMSERGRVNFSEAASGSSFAGHEDWVGLAGTNFFRQEARPDPIIALTENTNEVQVWGTNSVQVYAPDPSFTYSPVLTRELGLAGSYALIKHEESFAFLDHRRRIQDFNGRNFQELSPPIQKTLHDMETVDDCFGYHVTMGPFAGLVFTFPTDQRAFCYQLGGAWSEWQGWDSVQNNWKPFSVTALTTVLGSNVHVVGLSDGRIGRLSYDANDDLGEPIKCYLSTGFVNHETNKRKHCLSVNITIRRGTTGGTTEPFGQLRYRDDEGPLSAPITIGFGNSNDKSFSVLKRGLGYYRKREWVLEVLTSDEFTLESVEEEFEVLEV